MYIIGSGHFIGGERGNRKEEEGVEIQRHEGGHEMKKGIKLEK